MNTSAAGGAVPDPNPTEILADVREGFEEIEAAISTAAPERCRPYVSPALYEQIVGTVADLRHQGHRRVHGAFEIISAEVVGVDSTAVDLPRATVRLHATSSLVDLDAQDQPVAGLPQPMAWTQELTAQRAPVTGRWLITELQPLTIQGPVTGPSGPPLSTRELTVLEQRERDFEEHAAGFIYANLRFINLKGPIGG